MFEVIFLSITYAIVVFVMSLLPHPDGGIFFEIVRWCLFAFGSWTVVLVFSHIKRVATDFHALTIGRPDMDNLPEWAEIDVDGNIQVKEKSGK